MKSRENRRRPGREDGSAARVPRGAEIALLVAILVGGAMLRLAYFADLRADPLYVSPALDAQLHDYWAWGIASGEWTPPAGKPDPLIATTPYFRPPGYPYVLSAIYRVAGRDPAAPRRDSPPRSSSHRAGASSTSRGNCWIRRSCRS